MSKKSRRTNRQQRHQQNTSKPSDKPSRRLPILGAAVVGIVVVTAVIMTQSSSNEANISTPAPVASGSAGQQNGTQTAAKQSVASNTTELPVVKVYKSPTCGCCGKWVEHMRDAGFTVETHNRSNMDAIKNRFGITPQQASCHTAVVGGYLIEGHVPAKDVLRLLDDKPAVRGLTVPGMVMGSPGMEGHRSDHYSVDTLPRPGQKAIQYARY